MIIFYRDRYMGVVIMINTILWDVDGTLLDFLAAEREAIRTLFRRFDIGECSDEMLQKYSAINKSYWERLERGEMTKAQILVGRFLEFFESEGIDTSLAPEFNEAYQLSLGDTIVYRDNSLDIIKSLHGKVKQYVVSNGTIVAQTKKLRLSGLGELMDGIFLSEDVGVEKPNIEFFNKVFESIAPIDKAKTLIIGDSLSSDIRGGNNAGILCCWYNPSGIPLTGDVHVDFEIRNLNEIYGILEQ